MELVVKPIRTDLVYQIFFKESALELAKEESRISLISKILKAFGLRLNDIKSNNETPSNDYIHFSRFYGPSFFDVAFGLEEVSATLQTPQNEAQVVDLYGRLFQIFEKRPISFQKMTIQRQLSTEGDATAFLKSLNPHSPDNFEKLLHGRGVYYSLKIPEHELTIFITLVDSLFVEGGLYLSVENQFLPNLYDFENAFKITKDHYDFILKGLNLNIEEQT